MTCLNENNADLLIAYFENTLNGAQRAEVEEHAAQCADCRGLLAVHTTLDAQIAPEVSPNFDARLYARIAEFNAKPWWHISNWKLVLPVTAVAAMLAVGVFVMQPIHAPAPVAKGDTVTVDIPQVEQALDDLDLLMPMPQAKL